jgi:tRNA/rRNA methyltransferase
MSNFGLQHLRLVNPYDPSFREARSAVGASELLAQARQFSTVAEAVADCSLVIGTTAGRNRGLQHSLRSLQEGAKLMRKRLVSGRVALLFGSEKRGLSNDDFSYCNWLMRIPTDEEHPSMNLGQAVAVCLYEIVRTRVPAQLQKLPSADAEQLERITTQLLDALRASGYVKPRATTAAEAKVRRMIRRLNLSAEDAELWLGMLRQILWKLRD